MRIKISATRPPVRARPALSQTPGRDVMRAQGAIENALFNPQLKIDIYGAVEPAGPGRAQTCIQAGLGPKRVGALFRHEARGADLGPGRGAGPRGLRPCAAPLRACQCLPGSVRATECSKSAVGSRALPGSGALSSGRRPGGVPCAEERPRPRSGSESVTPPPPWQQSRRNHAGSTATDASTGARSSETVTGRN